MPTDTSITIRYAAIASVAAIALFYVLGPTLIPNEEHKTLSKHGAVGLTNPGNDCFINSILQALAASPKLRAYLEGSVATHSRAEDCDDDQSPPVNIVTEALFGIVERLNSPTLKGKTTSARDFIRALEISYNARMQRQQQDAQEFLQFVVQKLDDEAVAEQKSGRSRQLPIHGTLESQVECLHCQYQPPATVSDFLVLSLNAPQQGSTSLDECFDGLLKRELIEDFVCARCKLQSVVVQKQQQLARSSGEVKEGLADDIRNLTDSLDHDPEQRASDPVLSASYQIPKRTISKHTSISHFPQVLMLHLSRSIFGSYSSKNTAKVTFGERLRLGTFDGHIYWLQSVVTHRGGHNSGHYETFRRQTLEDEPSEEPAVNTPPEDNDRPRKQRRKQRKADKWWGISDDKVRECRTQDVLALQRECYLLFYEEMDPDPSE